MILYLTAALIVINIVLSHWSVFVKAYYLLYSIIIKPKYKTGDVVFVFGELHRVIHISKPAPYLYLCTPLNKNSNRLSNYYSSKIIKPASDLTKALF